MLNMVIMTGHLTKEPEIKEVLTKKGEIQLRYVKEIICDVGEALEQDAQRRFGCLIPEGVQGQV